MLYYESWAIDTFNKWKNAAKNAGEVFHIDLCGKICQPFIRGSYYWKTITQSIIMFISWKENKSFSKTVSCWYISGWTLM